MADANAVVQLAQKVKLRSPRGHLKWDEVGVITITDASASFSNERRTTIPNRDDVTVLETSRRSKTATATATGTESYAFVL